MRDPNTDWLRVQVYRRMSPQQRLQIVCQLNQTMRDLATSDVVRAFPSASSEDIAPELRRRLLPPDLFAKVEQSLRERTNDT